MNYNRATIKFLKAHCEPMRILDFKGMEKKQNTTGLDWFEPSYGMVWKGHFLTEWNSLFISCVTS